MDFVRVSTHKVIESAIQSRTDRIFTFVKGSRKRADLFERLYILIEARAYSTIHNIRQIYTDTLRNMEYYVNCFTRNVTVENTKK